MEVIAYGRYLRTSSRKLQPLASLIRGKSVAQADLCLKLSGKKAGRVLGKVLNSAMANAEHNFKLNRQDLIVTSVFVDEGSRLKRFRPVSRGKAHPFHKATAHICVKLGERKNAKDVLTSSPVSDKKKPVLSKSKDTGNKGSKK